MAAPGGNLLSVGLLSGMEQNTFTKHRELFRKKSSRMQLQQRLQELKERERRAHQHNRQLLLQFERAQDTLREMLARNAAMKTIRMEYERYLDENFHRWEQQLQEKTQAYQKKRMEDCLTSYLQHNKDPVSTATADQPLGSQDPSMRVPKCDAPQTYPTSYPEASWLTQAGILPGSLRAPFQPQSPPLIPPPSFPHSPTAWARPEAGGWARPRYTNLNTDGLPQTPSSQLHTEEPSASRGSQMMEGGDETRAGSSQRVRGDGGRRSLSPELDVQPVRLSSGPGESNESGRDSSLTSGGKKKRKKKGREKPSSSESEGCAFQKSSRTSSEVVAAPCTVALGSETSSSSEEGGATSRRSVNSGSPPSEREAEEPKQSEEEEKSERLSEKVTIAGQDSKAGSFRGEEGSDEDVVKNDNGDADIDDEEVISSEQSNTEERDEEKEVKGKENDDKVPPSRNHTEDEEEEEEQSDNQENEDRDDGKKDSASSLGEDEESEGREKIEEESSDEEDQLRSEDAGDSEDSIISPLENRSRQMKNVPEEAAEDEEDTQSSNQTSDEEDIENLLAPQEPASKTEKVVKTDGKPKAAGPNLSIFQVAEEGAKAEHHSDSDESDHFYD